MAGKGEPAAMLLSPSCSSPIHGAIDPHQPSGSQFTSFLTAPLQAFLNILGFSGSDIHMVCVSVGKMGRLGRLGNQLNG